MSGKSKKSKKKSKLVSDPIFETLKKTQNENQQLHLHLDRRRALTAQASFRQAVSKNTEIEVKTMLKTLQSDSKDLAIFMSTQHEVNITAFKEKLKSLEDVNEKIKKENEKLNNEIKQLKQDFLTEIRTKDDTIKVLNENMANQAGEYEVLINETFIGINARLNECMGDWMDYEKNLTDALRDKLKGSNLVLPPQNIGL
ncbi:hypothetical protein Ciccas_006014 [Cichlidogyrus casuarinus]|uniref:Coiled-coil domain-containing protein 153 n=1 Tax=Cichlidogyrus casuarinus TaxID=1844966 RepID=A0ABD2Q704_9PLAT